MSWRRRKKAGRAVVRLWHSNAAGPALTRTLLTPLAWAFGAGVRLRNALFDRGVFQSTAAGIPVVSVGNLSVGGTGKTPLAAYLALRLKAAGASPALVMRGVGGDESRAYAVLAPGVPVITDPNRIRGVQTATAQGADIAILDDAFQHRWIRRDIDVVVLGADRRHIRPKLLPAGPQREPLGSLRRASLVVIVRKAASRESVERNRELVYELFPDLPIVEVSLEPAALVNWRTGDERDLDSLREQRVMAVAGIGNPDAFFRQLLPKARHLQQMPFRDHHAFTERDARFVAGRAAGFDAVVCTLKDAVKLGPIWPRQAPELWYVSQRLEVENGEAEIQRIFARLLDLRPTNRK
ncbi:MAG: tetraacyldisaccharide 4'-kinase [Gemmatimonadaceae bacterium]